MSSFSSSGFPAHLFFWGCLANQLNSLDTGATALYVREAQRSGAYARTERNLVWRIAARNLVLRKGGDRGCRGNYTVYSLSHSQFYSVEQLLTFSDISVYWGIQIISGTRQKTFLPLHLLYRDAQTLKEN